MRRTMCLGVRSSSFFVDVFTDDCEPAGEFCTMFHDEGGRGLYRRISLTLLGMSNYTLQFIA